MKPANKWWPVEHHADPPINWEVFWRTLREGLESWTERSRNARPTARTPRDSDGTGHREARDAAALLGVDLDATVTEIRSAMRATMMATGAHPDHGSDGEEAMRMLAARDLLIARAKRKGAQP